MPDLQLGHQFGDLRDGQEVPGKPQLRDHVQLTVHPRAQRFPAQAGDGAVPVLARVESFQAGVAAGPELGIGVCAESDHGGFRDHGLSHVQVRDGVLAAAFGQPVGVGEQVRGPGGTQVRGRGDLMGEPGHLRSVLEPALSRGLQYPGVRTGQLLQGHQCASGVQHVRGDGLPGVGVAHGVGEDHREPGLTSHGEHPHGVTGAEGAALRCQVGCGLHNEAPCR